MIGVCADLGFESNEVQVFDATRWYAALTNCTECTVSTDSAHCSTECTVSTDSAHCSTDCADRHQPSALTDCADRHQKAAILQDVSRKKVFPALSEEKEDPSSDDVKIWREVTICSSVQCARSG